MSKPTRAFENETQFLDEEAQAFIAQVETILSDPDDLEVAIGQVIPAITAYLSAAALSIFVVNADTGELLLQFATGAVSDQLVGLRLQSGQGVVGWVVQHGEDLIVPYPGLDTRFFSGIDRRTGFSTRSILCSPIQSEGKVIGAIEVLNKQTGTFNDEDLMVLRALSHRLAPIIQHLRNSAAQP
jgi:GAF domain-containing protein